jgi:hypothetical protein
MTSNYAMQRAKCLYTKYYILGIARRYCIAKGEEDEKNHLQRHQKNTQRKTMG